MKQSRSEKLISALVEKSLSGKLDDFLGLSFFIKELNMYQFGTIKISADMVESIRQNPQWCKENWIVLEGEPQIVKPGESKA